MIDVFNNLYKLVLEANQTPGNGWIEIMFLPFQIYYHLIIIPCGIFLAAAQNITSRQ